jgi:hypothetical protein
MIAHSAADNHSIPGWARVGPIADWLNNFDAGRANVQPIAMPLVDDLGIPGDKLNTCLIAGTAKRFSQPGQHIHRQSFFQNKPGA